VCYALNMVLEISVGNEITISVVGSSTHPNINAYECEILSNETRSEVSFPCVEGTLSSRKHPSPDPTNPLFEYNATVFARDLFSEKHIGLPYGSNPRLPVLCPTFTDIYGTVTSLTDNEYLNFLAFNTGMDIFAESISQDGNTITCEFTGQKHGIANGGLTYSVLQYALSQNLLPEDLRVSIRIWSRAEQSLAEQTKVADKRNSHRPLIDIDKLNVLGAFDLMKSELDEAFVERISWHTGDQKVDHEGFIKAIDYCRLLYTFKLKSSTGNERHPTMNPLESDSLSSVYESIEKSGVITSPDKGLKMTWESIGGDE
jgi:hypothetical protein